jgi:uncharacterized membrane protein
MWTRSELKEYAKGFLRSHYWKAFIVVLITTLLMNGFGRDSGTNTGVEFKQTYEYVFGEGSNVTVSLAPALELFRSVLRNVSPLGYLAIGTVTFLSIVISIVMLLLGFIVEVGKSKFFLEGFKGDVDINKLFFGFNSRDYLPIIKAQGLAFIYILLWTLLFIIPGIVKGYQYRYVPYLLAEDPSLAPNEALSKSKEMTMGHKWNIFILDLSFFLWGLLSLITFGLSTYFVAPYIEATNARLYNVLKGESNIQY